MGLEMSKKPVRDAGVTTLLLCACDMEREITQVCMLEGVMLGALEWLRDIDDAYAKLETKLQRKPTAPCQFSISTGVYSMLKVILHV